MTVNLDTIGYVWTGEFDLNTLRVDGEIFVSGRKNCGFKNIRIRVDGAFQGCLRNLSTLRINTDIWQAIMIKANATEYTLYKN